MADLEKMAEEIVALTLKEAKELSDILKDKYGIEPAAADKLRLHFYFQILPSERKLRLFSVKVKKNTAGYLITLVI